MSDNLIAIFSAAGVIAAVSTVLAVLLLVAERYLINYGPCKITVNDEKEFTVTGGESLLASLKSQGIFIPSACGGRGTCAYCKVEVLDGAGPLVPTEEPLLSDEEKQSNVRISCQVKVRNDIAIRVPEQLMSVKQYRGRVERIRDLTHDIKELRIELIDPETIDFHCGHYIQLETPEYDGNAPVSRAYSISSMPDDNHHLELIIRLVPGGICTTWVFEHLKEGDEVTFTGPFGDFRVSETDLPMVWIAGGSGMAPFWSMVRHLKQHGNTRPVHYFFGAVSQEDLFFVDELKQLQDELEWFTYTPALSGEDLGDWAGDRGLITEAVDKHVEQDTDAEGYLCGSPGMCDASVKVLEAKGIPENKVYFDKFA